MPITKESVGEAFRVIQENEQRALSTPPGQRTKEDWRSVDREFSRRVYAGIKEVRAECPFANEETLHKRMGA